jgi:hypothetical protein
MMATATTTPIPLEVQLACAKRELRLRRRSYAKWVPEGKMTEAQAAHELAAMQAIVRTLQDLLERQQLPLFGGEDVTNLAVKA